MKFHADARRKIGALVWLLVLVIIGPVHAGAKEKLIIFHAGSLSIPFKQISEAFVGTHPNVRVVREAAGSRTCARKISDLGRPCDVMASADYTVIE
ncbi:MAG: tungstate ABC transporter substrate-binding protein WtpA, partial [Deltaproteobacteria bacterium]